VAIDAGVGSGLCAALDVDSGSGKIDADSVSTGSVVLAGFAGALTKRPVLGSLILPLLRGTRYSSWGD
jgi:hypothetical protein